MAMYASFSMSRPQNGIEWSEGRANKVENLLLICMDEKKLCFSCRVKQKGFSDITRHQNEEVGINLIHFGMQRTIIFIFYFLPFPTHNLEMSMGSYKLLKANLNINGF